MVEGGGGVLGDGLVLCPSIVALDDGKVLALTGVDKVVGEGLAGCHKECLTPENRR